MIPCWNTHTFPGKKWDFWSYEAQTRTALQSWGGAVGWMKPNPPMLPLSLSNSPVGGTSLGPCSKHCGKVDSFQLCWKRIPKSLFFPCRIPWCPPTRHRPSSQQKAQVTVGRKASREAFRGNQTCPVFWGDLVGWESCKDRWILFAVLFLFHVSPT